MNAFNPEISFRNNSKELVLLQPAFQNFVMFDFSLERFLPTLIFFMCVVNVPKVEPYNFPIFNWFENLLRYNSNEVAEINDRNHNLKSSPSFHKSFKIIWNVPTFQCHKYGLNFSEVKEWGITQNYGDPFRGDKIALLYDPGLFPALLETTAEGDLVKRNGGVPQEGNITSHLEILADQIKNKLIPDEHFSGVGIIDFEHWRPVWGQHFGSLLPYKKVSRAVEQQRHPLWSSSEIDKEASKRFEKAAWQFIRRSLKTARKIRPKALWGYYGFPLCFNFTPKNNRAKCSDQVMEDNERIKWLFEESSAIYPSLYYKKYSMTQDSRAQFMEERIKEAIRVSRMSASPSPVYPYIWLKYYDVQDFVERNDLINSFAIPKKEGAAGVIIWGASNDVNTEKKCRSLYNYVQNVLGPVIKQILITPKEQISAIWTNNIIEKPVEPGDNNVDYVFR